MKSFSKMFVITFLWASVLPVTAQTSRSSETKAQWEKFTAQRHSLQQQGLDAFEKEMAREKTEPCPEARSDYEQNACLRKEIEITENNYKTYVDSIRALLALKLPSDGSANASGPFGKPSTEEELVKEFNNVQPLWQQYRKAGSDAAYNYYKGGSIAPILGGQAELKIIHSHMHELDAIYAMILVPLLPDTTLRSPSAKI